MAPGELPRITHDLPGTGGRIKAQPSHFVVEELPLYEPCGEGEHVYLRVRREGRTTHELSRGLGRLFDLPSRAIGAAGRKDKQALATQTFSLHLHEGDPGELAARVTGELGIEVLDASRHTNKLRRGHLIGNRFTIRIADIEDVESALPLARATCAAIEERGLANYFGPQRFGGDGANAERGLALLARLADGKRRRRRPSDRDRLMLTAWQAELFNRWLAQRIERGGFDELYAGDLAHKTDTGGLFDVEDIETERPRFHAREITYTGPMFGARMRWPGGRPGDEERELLARALEAPASGPLDESCLRLSGLDGTRRDGRIEPRELSLTLDDGALVVSFALPKGAYATTLLDELMKTAPGAGEPEATGSVTA